MLHKLRGSLAANDQDIADTESSAKPTLRYIRVTASRLASGAGGDMLAVNEMNIAPAALKTRMDAGEKFRLIDVREADEWEIVRLPAAELVPLSQFQQLAPQELATDEEIVVYCHHGVRSARAQGFLKSQGYGSVLNLTGGIDAWALQVDPKMKRY